MDPERRHRLALALDAEAKRVLGIESTAACGGQNLSPSDTTAEVRFVEDGFELDYTMRTSWHPHTFEHVRVTVRSLP